ncbi:protein of unknown function [Enterobacter cancerogenus]|nr:protein of unknown function [Enterobacter cancerogenus]
MVERKQAPGSGMVHQKRTTGAISEQRDNALDATASSTAEAWVRMKKGPTFVDPSKGRGIRTPGPFPAYAFLGRCVQPLRHPTILGVDKIYLMPFN